MGELGTVCIISIIPDLDVSLNGNIGVCSALSCLPLDLNHLLMATPL